MEHLTVSVWGHVVLATPCCNCPQSLSPTFCHELHPSGEEVISGLDLSVCNRHISPLLATELQELALGPRPRRPDQGRCSSPNPPTAARQAAGVGPCSPATAPRPGSSFISKPTHWHQVVLHKDPKRKPHTTLSIGVQDQIALLNRGQLQVPTDPDNVAHGSHNL